MSGCLYHAKEHTDETVSGLVGHPYDAAPAETVPATPPKLLGVSESGPTIKLLPELDVQTTAYMAEAYAADQPSADKPKFELRSRPKFRVPRFLRSICRSNNPIGSAHRRSLPATAFAAVGFQRPFRVRKGRPYTLSQLQQLAAANSPELRQAASDVEAARGKKIQALAYPNPTVGWEIQSVERRQRARRPGSLYGPTNQDGRQVETCVRVGRNGFAKHGNWPCDELERLVDPRTKLVLWAACRQRNGAGQSWSGRDDRRDLSTPRRSGGGRLLCRAV